MQARPMSPAKTLSNGSPEPADNGLVQNGPHRARGWAPLPTAASHLERTPRRTQEESLRYPPLADREEPAEQRLGDGVLPTGRSGRTTRRLAPDQEVAPLERVVGAVGEELHRNLHRQDVVVDAPPAHKSALLGSSHML